MVARVGASVNLAFFAGVLLELLLFSEQVCSVGQLLPLRFSDSPLCVGLEEREFNGATDVLLDTLLLTGFTTFLLSISESDESVQNSLEDSAFYQ